MGHPQSVLEPLRRVAYIDDVAVLIPLGLLRSTVVVAVARADVVGRRLANFIQSLQTADSISDMVDEIAVRCERDVRLSSLMTTANKTSICNRRATIIPRIY